MTYEGLKAFATYFLSQADRGLEKEEVDLIPAYLDGAISKFGVGATQAVSIVIPVKQYNQCKGLTRAFIKRCNM